MVSWLDYCGPEARRIPVEGQSGEKLPFPGAQRAGSERKVSENRSVPCGHGANIHTSGGSMTTSSSSPLSCELRVSEAGIFTVRSPGGIS